MAVGSCGFVFGVPNILAAFVELLIRVVERTRLCPAQSAPLGSWYYLVAIHSQHRADERNFRISSSLGVH